jgi:aminoglycoside 3-N-acetyltransferase
MRSGKGFCGDGPVDPDGTPRVVWCDIAQGLRSLGICSPDVIFVHSSLSSFGSVEGGAEAVIKGLLAAVAPEGTVMVPTLTGSRELGPEYPPYFDVRASACWTGLIPETFRQRPEALRSLHPTHSVAAIGPRSQEMLEGHELSPTPCGPETPYGRLVRAGGWVVLLGVGLACVTLFHHVEEVAGLSYHMQPEPVQATVVDDHGASRTVRVWLHLYGPWRGFDRLEPELREEGLLLSTHVGAAEVRAIRAKPMVEYALELVRADPRALLRERD